MRSSDHSVFTLTALIVFASLTWSAEPRRMVDPLLGLSFDPLQVKFDVLPPRLAESSEFKGTEQWVFAAYSDVGSSTHFYIVAGLQKVHADTLSEAYVVEPDFGAVVSASSKGLEILGVPDRLFDKHPLLPSDLCDNLLRDAAQRYVRAFGGAQELSRAITVRGPGWENIPSRFAIQLKAVGVNTERNAVDKKLIAPPDVFDKGRFAVVPWLAKTSAAPPDGLAPRAGGVTLE